MNTIFARTVKFIAVVAVMIAFTLPVLAAKPGIAATIEPSQIAVGEDAQLTVSVIGDSGDEPKLPRVDGLQFTPMGQSSQYQSVNGAVTTSNSFTYSVTANRKGTFTIPAIKIGQGGNAQATRPITLRVTASRFGATPQSSPQSAPSLPAPNISGGDEDRAVSSSGQQAFLRLVAPKRELYVGQLVPVEIKAYFRAGLQASINGSPSLSSNAFTLNSLEDKPVQTEEAIEGQPYAVLTWTTAMTPVKAGNYSVSLELPVLLTVREKRSMTRSPFGDPFADDSFFDDFFGNSVEKQVTLTSEANTQSVQSPPATNRPAEFGGALGQFTIAATASPDHVTVGDPITLRLTVTGQGNFDRVSSDLLANSSDWKSYKPVARFASDDSVGFEGTKTFEQAIVPLKVGHLQIPSLRFSYFDPQKAKYVTLTTTPRAMEVAAGTNLPAVNSPPAPVASAIANSAQPDFAPNRIEAGHFISTLRPLFLQPWFLLTNLCGWLGLLGICYFLRRHDRRTRDPRIARARQADLAIHEQLAAMDVAIDRAETAPFFAAARGALQQRLGQRWDLPPETITLTEINARLNGEADGIRPVFQMADQVAYSHEQLPPGDLSGWKRILTEQLKQLETR